MKIEINTALVKRLVTLQFPKWKDLPIRPILPGGWDNRSFRLGNHMLIRLPSAEAYSGQVTKEHKWLPKLSPSLPLQIPSPFEIGMPTNEYPWNWSIYSWLEGEAAVSAHIDDKCQFATSLALFIKALQGIDSNGGPPPGAHNFYRGGSLVTYDTETRKAILALKERIDTNTATKVWESALDSSWGNSPVWVHGDISAGNLLVEKGRLTAVIDFGILAVGDPACDLAITWTFFEGENREVFLSQLPLDPGTWARARAWALWKALIVAAGQVPPSNSIEDSQHIHLINEILNDYLTLKK